MLSSRLASPSAKHTPGAGALLLKSTWRKLWESSQVQNELLNRQGKQISVNEITKTLPAIRHLLSPTNTRRAINERGI